MAGLYVRQVAPNTSSPAMRVAVSQGAAGGIPRGGGASFSRGDPALDAEKLGGLLGLLGGEAERGSAGVFNASVMPGVGQGLTSPVTTQAADTAAMLQGSNVDVASRMAADAANLPLPAMAGQTGSGVSAAGMKADLSGLNLNFDPSRAGLLGAFGLGG